MESSNLTYQDFQIQRSDDGEWSYDTTLFNPVKTQGGITLQEVEKVLDDIARIPGREERRKAAAKPKVVTHTCCTKTKQTDLTEFRELNKQLEQVVKVHLKKLNEEYAHRKIRFININHGDNIRMELDYLTEIQMKNFVGGNNSQPHQAPMVQPQQPGFINKF